MKEKIKIMRGMVPNGYAAACGNLKNAEYTLRFDGDDWCRVFSGRNKVWECNGSFARAQFFKGK